MATTNETRRVTLAPTGQPGKWEPPELHGRGGLHLGFSPVGYARVLFDGDAEARLVHPESLTAEVVP